MPRQTYIPVPQEKGSGCLKICVLLAMCIGMFFVIVYFSPGAQVNRNHLPAKGQSFIEQVQQLLQQIGHSTSTPTAQHSSLSSPSGSCFDMARLAAIQNGIDPTLFARQINQESGCQASVCSSAGACGVAQLMPEMAASFHVDPTNVSQSLSVGAHLMASYLKMYNGSWPLALACYNASTGETAHVLKTFGNDWYAHLPLETQNYITAITGGQA